MVAYIEACRDQFGVEPVCRALRQAGVRISPSGYYAARARPPRARAVREAALEKQILRVWKDSGERYGAWKVWDQLNREGIAVARCTVERLMRTLGLRGVRRGGWKKPRTTVPDPSQDRPADLVSRGFAPDAPDRLWVVDFTFVATRAGTAYTALVIDAFARLITGWRTAANHGTDLVLDALVMAVTYRARQGVKVAGLIHHSDAGSEYLSIRYGAELAAAGIAPSVGSVGDSYDNALAESVIGLYKTEVIDHLGPWETPARVEAATSEWASWYNTARVMRRTAGRPPAEYEQAWRDGTPGQVPARGPGSRPRRQDEGGGHGRRSLPRRAPPAPAGAPPRTPALLDITMTRDTLRTAAALPPDGTGHTDTGLPEQMDLADRIERDVDQSGRLDPGNACQTAALDIIAAAVRAELPLWCDDNVLRRRARAARVAAFSVVDLLAELSQDAVGREAAWRALAGQYVTDLPIGAGTITALVGDWQPGPAHTAIARPGWWQYHAASWAGEWLAIAAAAAGSGDPGNLTHLTLAALTGALQAVPPGLRTQRYQQLAAVTLIACHDARAQPPPVLLAAMADYAGPSVAARPEYVLGELIIRLRARAGTLDPVGIATTLLPGIPPV